jgi:hypothetical protein
MSESITITTSTPGYFCDGIQLRPRKLVPKFLGDFVLWLFFHRLDTSTRVVLSGFTEGGQQ